MDSFKIIAQHNTAVTLINLPLLTPQTLIRVSILEMKIKFKKKPTTLYTRFCVIFVYFGVIHSEDVNGDGPHSIKWKKDRDRDREREGEGLINVLAMINGLSVAITNWLCF